MFTKTMRLGRDPELRLLADGTPVMNLALAYSYGKKGADGKKPTQWIEAGFFGKQAAAVHPYLHKGDQVGVSISDLHVETYEGKNGVGHKLSGRVVAFDFVGENKHGASTQVKPEPTPPPKSNAGFDNFDDDIPF